MSMVFLPVAHVLRPQAEAYQRLAWFLWECLEREHLITLRAWAASVPAVGLRATTALHPFGWLLAPPEDASFVR